MCGIVGMVDHAGFDPACAGRRLDAAVDRLAPRGPDGSGRWQDGPCLLGHRRLAIVDLSDAGAQPMVRHGLAISFNGMIYNYRALRAELAAAGHRFATDCDTEVLLAGWRQWGPGLLPRLAGMFAFALWDPARRELVLARDRQGKKPLLYRREGGRLVFASELRALQLMDGRAGEVDPEAVRLFFALRYVPEPRSILRGVAKLPAGHMARLTEDGFTVEAWHRPEDERPDAYHSPADAAADLRDRIETAVADRLVADVPVGAFLSGGIDSAVVAACMVRHTPSVRTFTIGFEGAADYYEERPAALAVAEHLGTRHTEIPVSWNDAISVVGKVFDGLDEPFADSSAIPTYLVSRETRRHVTVALSGDGADELFGGYRKYQGELYARAYQRIPGFLRQALVEPLAGRLPESKTGRWSERARRLRRFVAAAGEDPVGRQAGWMAAQGAAELDALLGPAPDVVGVEGLVREARAASGQADPLNAMLAADMALGLTGDMLVKVDRMSMANGLEVRCPMLDHRVVGAAFAMPGHYKLRRGRGKAVLRDAFADMLPRSVFALPKKGFEVPIAQWLTGPLAGLVQAAISPERLRRQGIVDPALPRAWFDDLRSRRQDSSERLWSLIAFDAWLDRQGSLRIPA